nr:hypothetical protein Iba_chr05dCG19630 [Ipomoea batatas]
MISSSSRSTLTFAVGRVRICDEGDMILGGSQPGVLDDRIEAGGVVGYRRGRGGVHTKIGRRRAQMRGHEGRRIDFLPAQRFTFVPEIQGERSEYLTARRFARSHQNSRQRRVFVSLQAEWARWSRMKTSFTLIGANLMHERRAARANRSIEATVWFRDGPGLECYGFQPLSLESPEFGRRLMGEGSEVLVHVWLFTATFVDDCWGVTGRKEGRRSGNYARREERVLAGGVGWIGSGWRGGVGLCLRWPKGLGWKSVHLFGAFEGWPKWPLDWGRCSGHGLISAGPWMGCEKLEAKVTSGEEERKEVRPGVLNPPGERDFFVPAKSDGMATEAGKGSNGGDMKGDLSSMKMENTRGNNGKVSSLNPSRVGSPAMKIRNVDSRREHACGNASMAKAVAETPNRRAPVWDNVSKEPVANAGPKSGGMHWNKVPTGGQTWKKEGGPAVGPQPQPQGGGKGTQNQRKEAAEVMQQTVQNQEKKEPAANLWQEEKRKGPQREAVSYMQHATAEARCSFQQTMQEASWGYGSPKQSSEEQLQVE